MLGGTITGDGGVLEREIGALCGKHMTPSESNKMWERHSGSESAALPGEMNCFKFYSNSGYFHCKHVARESWMTAKPLRETLRGGPNQSIPTSFAALQAIDNALPLSRSLRERLWVEVRCVGSSHN